MIVMKWKFMLIAGGLGMLSFLALLMFVVVFISDEEGGSAGSIDPDIRYLSLPEDVLTHQPMVEKYASKYGIAEYVPILLAIIAVESGGNARDVMQSSESLGLPPNSLDTEASIEQGTKYFAELLRAAETKGVDESTVIQAYNYGGAFIDYVAQRGKVYSFELAESFAKERSGGSKVTYSNPIAVEKKRRLAVWIRQHVLYGFASTLSCGTAII